MTILFYRIIHSIVIIDTMIILLILSYFDFRRNFKILGAFNLGDATRCVFRVGARTIVGCSGLDSDSKILMDKLREMLVDHYEFGNFSDLEPENIAHLISDILYDHSLLISPIVIGLDSEYKPYICAMDELGEKLSSLTLLYICRFL